MDEELKDILTRFTNDLQGWLNKPSSMSEKITQLEADAASLSGVLASGALAKIKKELAQAQTQATREKLREAAKAIAEVSREKGVILTPGEPLKRRRRKNKPPAQ